MTARLDDPTPPVTTLDRLPHVTGANHGGDAPPAEEHRHDGIGASSDGHDNHHHGGHDLPTTFTVTITYNGLSKPFTVAPAQSVLSLIETALDAFDVRDNRHLQALYSPAGELADGSLHAAGVNKGAHLLLRPSQVRGGTPRPCS